MYLSEISNCSILSNITRNKRYHWKKKKGTPKHIGLSLFVYLFIDFFSSQEELQQGNKWENRYIRCR